MYHEQTLPEVRRHSLSLSLLHINMGCYVLSWRNTSTCAHAYLLSVLLTKLRSMNNTNTRLNLNTCVNTFLHKHLLAIMFRIIDQISQDDSRASWNDLSRNWRDIPGYHLLFDLTVWWPWTVWLMLWSACAHSELVKEKYGFWTLEILLVEAVLFMWVFWVSKRKVRTWVHELLLGWGRGVSVIYSSIPLSLVPENTFFTCILWCI